LGVDRKKSPEPDSINGKFYQIFKEAITLILNKLL